MDAHWRAVRRDLDVTTRTRDNPTPKKRTLGVAPVIFLMVDAPVYAIAGLFGPTPRIYLCICVGSGSPEDDKKKRDHFFECDIESDERAKRADKKLYI